MKLRKNHFIRDVITLIISVIYLVISFFLLFDDTTNFIHQILKVIFIVSAAITVALIGYMFLKYKILKHQINKIDAIEHTAKTLRKSGIETTKLEFKVDDLGNVTYSTI